MITKYECYGAKYFHRNKQKLFSRPGAPWFQQHSISNFFGTPCMQRYQWVSNLIENLIIQVRNPWGDRQEWRGTWKDGAREWGFIPDEVRWHLCI